MATSVKEIEVKASISDPVVLLNKLKAFGCVPSDPVHQEDKVFLAEGVSYDSITPGANVLRIRTVNNTVLFTAKQKTAVALSLIEHELEIHDASEMEAIIKQLGYYEVVRVSKERISITYQEYEINIDTVSDLGTYVEVEKKSAEDPETVQAELFSFLKQFGISDQDRVTQGYDLLVYKQQGLDMKN